ncbi:MAG: 30S ribosomal protein S3 [Thermoprotei archaeon]|jgi:small subunit ribosomal protein S3
MASAKGTTIKKQFLLEVTKRMEVIQYLKSTLKRARIGNIEIQSTPLGSMIIIEAERLALIIGRHGLKIKEIAKTLEEKFGLLNPQISVSEIQNPALNPVLIAEHIASALERGIHFRRAANIALRQIMDAGARGAEIIITGKLVSERSRREKFRAGVLLKAGQYSMEQVKTAVTSVLLKPGIVGIQVNILPPVELPEDTLRKFEITEEKVVNSESSGDQKVQQ